MEVCQVLEVVWSDCRQLHFHPRPTCVAQTIPVVSHRVRNQASVPQLSLASVFLASASASRQLPVLLRRISHSAVQASLPYGLCGSILLEMALLHPVRALPQNEMFLFALDPFFMPDVSPFPFTY